MFAALKKNDADLEDARTYNMQLKTDQQKEVEHYLQETERLKKQMSTWESDLRKYGMEEEQEVERLDKIRKDYELMREKMEQKLNDLRYGVKLYSALGLTFDKADSADLGGEGAGMTFRFTQISKADPTCEFVFKIKVHADRTLEKFKARLCVVGTGQVQGGRRGSPARHGWAHAWQHRVRRPAS